MASNAGRPSGAREVGWQGPTGFVPVTSEDERTQLTHDGVMEVIRLINADSTSPPITLFYVLSGLRGSDGQLFSGAGERAAGGTAFFSLDGNTAGAYYTILDLTLPFVDPDEPGFLDMWRHLQAHAPIPLAPQHLRRLTQNARTGRCRVAKLTWND